MLEPDDTGAWLWITDRVGGVALMEVTINDAGEKTFVSVGKYDNTEYGCDTVIGWLPLITPVSGENPDIRGQKTASPQTG
jgi:hypothetical protein